MWIQKRLSGTAIIEVQGLGHHHKHSMLPLFLSPSISSQRQPCSIRSKTLDMLRLQGACDTVSCEGTLCCWIGKNCHSAEYLSGFATCKQRAQSVSKTCNIWHISDAWFWGTLRHWSFPALSTLPSTLLLLGLCETTSEFGIHNLGEELHLRKHSKLGLDIWTYCV